IASWGPFAIHAQWCRRWKDSIDRKFMSLFSDFPEMSFQQAGAVARTIAVPAPPSQRPPMYCAGCGSKVGASTLTRVLRRVRAEAPDDTDWPGRNAIYAGLETPDDAAIVQVPNGQLAVHSVDHFSALVDDPFIFGQICVNHCLSDLFAMGATSHSALALATIPYGTDPKQEETLYQLLSGALRALANAKTFLVGGHTTEGASLSLGFACNGWIRPDQVWRKRGMVPGQSLILTKALGTGTLFAADQQRQAKGRWIEAAIDSMLQSNLAAAECLKQYGATACTDVTGFGLAGHLLEMIQASKVNVALEVSALSLLPGAAHTLNDRIVSSLHQRNQASVISAMQSAIPTERLPTHLPAFQILFDPQTSGGLLASVPSENTSDCLAALHRLGYGQSACIGQTSANTDSALNHASDSALDGASDRPGARTKPLTITKW
ncbi:MAG: selenide, water dikinase SelD, partial [Phormidesmis sp. RL_2_1]|nr:selenide, water dikinase SelD [Phormidesmis sp. RL_2_1]